MEAYTLGITKEQFVKETERHQAADAFIHGRYSKLEGGQFRGCAVGCAIESINILKGVKEDNSDHQQYEKYLGIPEWIARLEDTIFEGVSKERAKTWPVEFAKAINEGSDLNQIKVPYILYLMDENLKSIRSCKYDAEAFPGVKKAIDQTEAAILQMIEAQKSGDQEKIEAARSAALSAESAALSAARSAARSAALSAESAARWAALSAASAARSAASAALSAASAALSATFERHGDKLLELMRDCK